MSVASIAQALPAGDRILLDTTALAAYFDTSEVAHPVARHILEEFVARGRNMAVVSMVTAMDILVRPLRATPPGHHTVLAFLDHHPNLEAVSLDLQMAQDAAFLRAVYRFSPPDALIIGTGLACQVAHLVTNDLDWERKLAAIEGRIAVCTLSRHLPFP
jgi:predicted nucleic acid-binding protein